MEVYMGMIIVNLRVHLWECHYNEKVGVICAPSMSVHMGMVMEQLRVQHGVSHGNKRAEQDQFWRYQHEEDG